nr:hypothetical protein [Priestia aryabhattai]MDH3135373.1 hypothetical protein [Priestia aryabhattai]
MKRVKKEKREKRKNKTTDSSWRDFEKYFEIQSEEEAEKIAKALQSYVGKNKDKILHHDVVVKKKAAAEIATAEE